jgi:hypothetical protein
MTTKVGKPFCHRCYCAAVFFLGDSDEKRAQEDWYRYQYQLEALDKKHFKLIDGATGEENCRHCGHAKKNGDGKDLFHVAP